MFRTSIVVVAACIWVVLFSGDVVDAEIGINWGRQSSSSLVPSMVVDLLLQNNVSAVKLYNFNDDIMKAFAGTGISVTIGVPRFEYINKTEYARQWVLEKIAPYPTVNLRYVLVGNNAFGVARFNKMNFSIVVNAVELMQEALDYMGYPQIKAVISNAFTGVLHAFITRPSEADFLDDVKESMLQALSLWNKTNAPFLFDIFPISYVNSLNVDTNYAFVDNKSTYSVTDVNGLKYTNLFDFVFDSFAWAIRKAGYDNMKIVVGQIGWPTDGYANSNVEAAERFWKSLLPMAMSDRGTPMRPGAPIDVYIHTLTDENKNPASLPFMRHWGVYRSNGEPKYKIDFSGRGRDIFPTDAKGINLMPSRWCVFNGDNSDSEKVSREVEFACQNSDCTTLAPGGSCSMLTPDESVSYAFNAYFQMNFQNENACRFDGLGEIVLQNPSRDGCIFLIEVVQGNQIPETPSRWG